MLTFRCAAPRCSVGGKGGLQRWAGERRFLDPCRFAHRRKKIAPPSYLLASDKARLSLQAKSTNRLSRFTACEPYASVPKGASLVCLTALLQVYARLKSKVVLFKKGSSEAATSACVLSFLQSNGRFHFIVQFVTEKGSAFLFLLGWSPNQ